MKELKVSVVIPTYKRPLLLERLLNTLALQTFKGYEVIVVDDGSPNVDAYSPVLEKFAGKINKLKFLKNEVNRGAPFCRNRGILESKHPLIALADDDDEWFPEKLERQTELFKTGWSDTDFVYSWIAYKVESERIGGESRPRHEGNLLRQSLRGELGVNTSSVMVKKEVLLRSGLFDESLPSCQDWDMWIRIFAMGYKAKPAKSILTLYHLQKDGISMSRQAHRGFILLALKHFRLYLRHSPLALPKLFLLAASRKLNLRPRWRIQRAINSVKTFLGPREAA